MLTLGVALCSMPAEFPPGPTIVEAMKATNLSGSLVWWNWIMLLALEVRTVWILRWWILLSIRAKSRFCLRLELRLYFDFRGNHCCNPICVFTRGGGPSTATTCWHQLEPIKRRRSCSRLVSSRNHNAIVIRFCYLDVETSTKEFDSGRPANLSMFALRWDCTNGLSDHPSLSLSLFKNDCRTTGWTSLACVPPGSSRWALQRLLLLCSLN